MKTKLTILGSLASLGAAASLNAQAVTAAVGYHTENLATGFNVLAVNVGNPVAAAGEFDADAATDNDVDFTALLTAGLPYTVQNITTGETAPVDAIVDANNITTSLGVSNGDRYEIRQDQTINDLFGAANEAGLLEGTGDTADVIWLSNGDGASYTQIFWNNVDDPDNFFDPKTPGWRAVGANLTTDQGGTVIPFTQGMFLQARAADPAPLVFVGHVRGEDDVDDGHGAQTTTIALASGFNVLSRVVPVGITVGEAGAAAMLTPGTADTGDVLWIPNGDGASYTQIYNNNVNDPDNFFDPSTPGLRQVGQNKTLDKSDEPLTSGFLVQRRAAAGAVNVEIPDRLDL